MYGEEPFVIDRTNLAATPTTELAVEATGACLSHKVSMPAYAHYWGYRVVAAFAYTAGITAQGVLELYRNTKRIVTAVLGNAGGLGYAVGDLLTVTQAGASGGILRVATITPATGAILTVEVVEKGWNYIAASNLATVAQNGSGNNNFTVTISDKLVLDTMNLKDGSEIRKQYMRRVPNILDDDVSPTPSSPCAMNAGEDLVIGVKVQATSTGQIVGDFQPILVLQNRAENFAAQGMWVENN
jgi:hypothetical protein